jgi:hypothetical protein
MNRGNQPRKRPPAQFLGTDRQTTALIVVQAQPLAAELIAPHTVLFLQVVNARKCLQNESEYVSLSLLEPRNSAGPLFT